MCKYIRLNVRVYMVRYNPNQKAETPIIVYSAGWIWQNLCLFVTNYICFLFVYHTLCIKLPYPCPRTFRSTTLASSRFWRLWYTIYWRCICNWNLQRDEAQAHTETEPFIFKRSMNNIEKVAFQAQLKSTTIGGFEGVSKTNLVYPLDIIHTVF